MEDPNDLSSVKICDFGLSGQLQYDILSGQTRFSESCGTRLFMAPELWKKKKYGKVIPFFIV